MQASAAAQASAPNLGARTQRRLKARPVIYKSSALERTAPTLVAAATPEVVSAAKSIQAANATAERIRVSYKSKKDPDVGDAVDGDDDASNAKKYERRLKMNRQSAAASRVRREAYTKALEAELINMEANYNKLLEMLKFEQEKNSVHVVEEVVDSADEAEKDEQMGPAPQQPQPEVKEENVPMLEEEELLHFDLNFSPAVQVHPDAPNPPPPKAEQLLRDESLTQNPDILHALPLPDKLPDLFEPHMLRFEEIGEFS